MAPEAIQNPTIIFTKPQTPPICLKVLYIMGHWKQNYPALKKKRKFKNNNFFHTPLITGIYSPKLLGENLYTFSVPLRCKSSTLSSLGPKSYSFKCKLNGEFLIRRR